MQDKLAARKRAELDVNKGLVSGELIAIQQEAEGYKLIVESRGKRTPVVVREEDPAFAVSQSVRGDYVVIEVEYDIDHRGLPQLMAQAMVNTTRRVQRKVRAHVNGVPQRDRVARPMTGTAAARVRFQSEQIPLIESR